MQLLKQNTSCLMLLNTMLENHVFFQVWFVIRAIATSLAHKWLVTTVDSHMPHQISLLGESGIANGAREWTFPGVNPNMHLQTVAVRKLLPTVVTVQGLHWISEKTDEALFRTANHDIRVFLGKDWGTNIWK